MASLVDILRPKSTRQTLIAGLLLYNPLISAAFTFVLGGGRSFVPSWLVATFIADVTMTLCFAGVMVVRRIDRTIYARRGLAEPKRSLGWSFAVSAAIMPAALPVSFAAAGAVTRALGVEWRGPDFAAYRVGVGFGLVMTLLFFLARARSQAREAEQAAAARIRDLENKRLTAQLSALTAEMNPHLLFNALNTVAALIPEDPERAEEVVVQLADLYRGVLRSARASRHPLADELRLCTAYLEVERARFGDRLVFDVTVGPGLDPAAVEVPVLVLQPFVENAVKHGIAPRARGGRVKLDVALEGGNVKAVVEDDGVGLGASTARGSGTAVENCRERIALTYGGAGALVLGEREGGGTRVEITFPARAPRREAP